jgi:L-threonylcarbamoyladenylate synthase
MRIIKAGDKVALDAAVETLGGGGVVSFPTETFYGLGVRFDMESALERLFALKGRSAEKAVSLIIGELEVLLELAAPGAVTPLAERLMRRHWPGPLTLVFRAREGLPPYLTLNGTVAVRVPGESFALRLARKVGFPITATSANPAGMPPPGDAETVREYFRERIDLLIDGGKTDGETPSTIADVTGDEIRIIREGAVALDESLKNNG